MSRKIILGKSLCQRDRVVFLPLAEADLLRVELGVLARPEDAALQDALITAWLLPSVPWAFFPRRSEKRCVA